MWTAIFGLLYLSFFVRLIASLRVEDIGPRVSKVYCNFSTEFIQTRGFNIHNLSLPTKPCCFPEVWKSRFHVKRRALSRNESTSIGLVRVRGQEVAMAIGKELYATEFCRGVLPAGVCATDVLKCPRKPFFGSPRCISPENGFVRASVRVTGEGQLLESWFTEAKRPNSLGGIERHSYLFRRVGNYCNLLSYELIVGQHENNLHNCDMLQLERRIFLPQKGTFRMNFDHSLYTGMLFC